MHDPITHVALFVAATIILVTLCIFVENLYWRGRDTQKSLGLKEISCNGFLALSYKLVDAAVLGLVVVFGYDLVKTYGLYVELPHTWLGYVFLYIVVDFGFYLIHVAMHKVRWFWTSHVTHHSSDRYNFSVALRQNFLVSINGTMLVLWVPAALIGFDKEMVLLVLEINLLYQFLLHTEMPSILDRFGYVLNTPSHHRVHHGSNPNQIDRNFGGTLIIWDRFFDTFLAEENAGKIAYGVTRNQPRGYNPIKLLFGELKDLLSDFWATKDVRIFLAPPGWVDEKYGASLSPIEVDRKVESTQID